MKRYIIAIDLFGINELYSKVPDNLLTPDENRMIPKINMIYPIIECVFIE